MTVALLTIVVIWSLAPGPITILIIKEALSSNRQEGVMTALGGCVGIAVYVVVAVLTSTTISDLDTWSEMIRFAGAIYFVTLGLMSVWQTLFSSHNHQSSQNGGHRGFTNGLIISCLSPQIALFYLVVVPNVAWSGMSAQMGILVVGATHFIVRLTWYTLLVSASAQFSGYLQRAHVQRLMNLAVGLTFTILGGGVLLL